MNKFELAQAFITAADTGSIHAAAAKLHQTNAAISKKITKLETYLKTQLLYRERKGVRLTESGQRYYHEAKKAMQQLAIAEQSVTHAVTKPWGKLKVVANLYYAQTMLLPKLSNFLTHYPELTVNIDIAEVLPDFNAKKMDILFGVSTVGEERLVRKKIDVTRYVLCASPTYLRKKGTPHSSAELLQHDFIAHSARKTNEIILLDHDEQIQMKPKIFLNNTSLIIQAALANLGFIWAHENMVSDLLVKKKLICFMEKYTRQAINIYTYYKYQLYPDPKIRAFMDFFTK